MRRIRLAWSLAILLLACSAPPATGVTVEDTAPDGSVPPQRAEEPSPGLDASAFAESDAGVDVAPDGAVGSDSGVPDSGTDADPGLDYDPSALDGGHLCLDYGTTFTKQTIPAGQCLFVSGGLCVQLRNGVPDCAHSAPCGCYHGCTFGPPGSTSGPFYTSDTGEVVRIAYDYYEAGSPICPP